MQRLIRSRLARVVVIIGLACLAASWPVYQFIQRIDRARLQYLSFVEAMYSNTAIRINFLPSREHTYPFAAHKALTVAIDDEIDPAYLARVESAFSTMAGFMDSTVTFRMVGADFDFRDDFYAYVGYKKDSYVFRPSFVADFTDKLRGAISRIYDNKLAGSLWKKFRLSDANEVFGLSYFINSEYASIPYDALISESEELKQKYPDNPSRSVLFGDVSYRIKDPSPSKGIVFISTRNDSKVAESKFTAFIRDTITQEIFQMLSQQNDLNESQFKLKTLLNDYDDVIDKIRPGVDENIDLSNENAPTGLCLLDTMYMLHIGSIDATNFRWQLMRSGWLTYAKLYLEAYRRLHEGPSDLFDPRCW